MDDCCCCWVCTAVRIGAIIIVIVFTNISNMAESSSVLIASATSDENSWAIGAAKELARTVS